MTVSISQTNQAQAKPVKKRRRCWLIVAFVAVTVSGIGCWYWPRGDVRFAGKWLIVDSPQVPSFSMSLGTNGQGLATWSHLPNVKTGFRWTVREDRFVVGPLLPFSESTIGSSAAELLRRFTGVRSPKSDQTYKFEIVRPGNVRITSVRSNNSGPLIIPPGIMERVSE